MKNNIEQDFLLQSDNALRANRVRKNKAAPRDLDPNFLRLTLENLIQPSSALLQARRCAENVTHRRHEFMKCVFDCNTRIH